MATNQQPGAGKPAAARDAARPMWWQLYFVLAAFDLLTISFSLYLNHRLMEIHDESVRINQEWVGQLNRFSDLTQLGGAVDAPGNDVFDSRDVEAEALRLRTSLARYEQKLAEAEAALFSHGASAQTDVLRGDLKVVRGAMKEMVDEAELIFSYFRRSEPGKAGERMATMDRKYAQLNEGFARLSRHIREIQTENFRAQQGETVALRRYEYTIAGAIGIMVLAVTIYGHRMARVMTAVMKEKEQHFHALQEVRDGLERRVEERTKELRESEERFAKAFQRAPVWISLTDFADGTYIDVNEEALQMSGFTRAEVIGHTAVEIGWITPENRARLVREMQEHGRVTGMEMTFRAKDGRTMHSLFNAELIVLGGRTCLLSAAVDLTARRQAEAARLQMEQKLQETQKLESLGVLAGGIAHDFNNLLTGILGNASLASLDLPASSPAQENLASIKQGTQRAADLCRQMLAYSGKGRFVVQNLSLNGLVEETTHLLQISISKKAGLRFNLHPALPVIRADATQIRQVLMNLVINASEAIGEKSGVISLTTGLTLVDQAYLGGTLLAPELPDGTYVHLEVADTGCGMSPEMQTKIFDPFFTTKFTGRGLGLAAVLGIVRGHKGALKIQSEPGRGTTFKVLFPGAAGETEAVAAGGAAKAFWRGQGCVLVVDDEESVRSTAALMLRKLGFSVALAADGRAAVEAFQAEPDRYVLVLMDLTMPHLDGEQAFTAMRRLRPEAQVVLMSGFNEQEAISQFTGKGLASFLQKPFQLEALSDTLQRVLAVTPRKTW